MFDAMFRKAKASETRPCATLGVVMHEPAYAIGGVAGVKEDLSEGERRPKHMNLEPPNGQLI